MASAQTRTITENVTDDQGVPLPGATILEQGTANGVTSDFHGNFSMEVADGATLEVSFVGYKSQTQSVEADSKYSFQMASGNLLEEVVVTSLGIKREAKALCYAVQNVTSETIAKSNATEALNGIEVLQPVCDSQASIYDEVHALLNSARQNLNQNDGGLPLSGDLIYSGDASLWIKATHAIEDRAYVHQGLLSNSNYTSALSSINQAFGSNEEDMTFKFGSSATTAAPWYQFKRDRGDIGSSCVWRCFGVLQRSKT